MDVPDTSTKNERDCSALSSKCFASAERKSSYDAIKDDLTLHDS